MRKLLGSFCHCRRWIWSMHEIRRIFSQSQVDFFNSNVFKGFQKLICPFDWLYSEQQLVDCSRTDGCSGGWEHEAWQYLASNGGQTDEFSYPYTAEVGTCMFPGDMPIGAQISSSNPAEWIASKDTTAMMNVLAGGRILSIYMQLPNSFFNYK